MASRARHLLAGADDKGPEAAMQVGNWYWFEGTLGKQTKPRPWILARVPERFRRGRVYPRSASDTSSGARHPHPRHTHEVSTCRLRKDGWITDDPLNIAQEEVAGAFCCHETSEDVLTRLEQWEFFHW